jgi:hypothetical protein
MALLECANAPAQRAHRAGPKMFPTPFSDEARESPPSAASATAFRAQALTSTVRHAALSDLACAFADGGRPVVTEEEVRQGGLCGRLRSNPSSKLLHAGRRRRELIDPLQTDFPTIFGPASGARIASPFTHSSRGMPLGTKALPDNPHRYLIPTQINNVPEYGS